MPKRVAKQTTQQQTTTMDGLVTFEDISVDIGHEELLMGSDHGSTTSHMATLLFDFDPTQV